MTSCADPLRTLAANVDYQVHCKLKTNREARGRLLFTDRFMNVVLGNATIIDSKAKTETTVEQCTIRGTSIRSIRLFNNALVTKDDETIEDAPEKRRKL